MQLNEELIQYVTKELMKRLAGNSDGSAVAGPKPVLLLVGRRDDLRTPALATLSQHFSLTEYNNSAEALPLASYVLITKLSIEALVRVAQGEEGHSPEGRALLSAILNGQPVAALAEGLSWRAYNQSAPQTLLAKYAQYERTLESYGLKILTEEAVLNTFLKGDQVYPQPTSGSISSKPIFRPAAQGKKRVISEADLMAACPVSEGYDQQFRLEPGDLLTPLAKDYALINKIRLVKAV